MSADDDNGAEPAVCYTVRARQQVQFFQSGCSEIEFVSSSAGRLDRTRRNQASEKREEAPARQHNGQWEVTSRRNLLELEKMMEDD